MDRELTRGNSLHQPPGFDRQARAGLTADDGALIAVDAACDFVRDVAEQEFSQVIGDEIYLDGSGTDALLLPELPVANVGTVALRDSAGSYLTMGSADYTLNGNGVLYATNTAGTSDSGTTWPRGRQNVRVTYDHGYTSGTAGDFPASVRQVALSIAARLYTQGPAAAESVGDVSVRYSVGETDFTAGELRILRKHRRAK